MEVANLSLTSNKCFPVLLKFDLHAYKNNKISFKRNNWITREFAKHTRWHSVSLDCILREVVLKKGLEINFSWKSRSAVYTVSELHFMQITMFRKIYTSYVSQWIKSSNQCLFSTRGKQVLNPLWNKSFLVWRTVPSRQRSASGMVGRRRNNFGTKVRRLLIKQFVPCSAAEVPFQTLFIVKFCLQN